MKPIPSATTGSLLAALAALSCAGLLPAAQPRPPASQDFDALHALVKPHAGESRWLEIDWYPSVQEARRRAAAEGKPIFLMAGSGGAPAAGC